MKRSFFAALLTIAVSLTATERAARASEGYLGAIFGPSFASENLGTVFADGGHFGIRFVPNFGFGATFIYENLANNTTTLSTSTATVSAVEYLLTLEPTVYPWSELGFYVGLRLGLGFTSVSSTTPVGGPSISGLPGSSSGVALGGETGYLLKVEKDFGVSLELNTTVVTGPPSPLILTNIMFGGNYVF